MSIALVESPTTALDALALAIVVMAIYNAAGFSHFCFVNLGETSLRIFILQMVMEAPQGLDLSEILDAYNDQHLIAIRLRRIADNGQARLSNGIFYPRRSLLFAASTILELLKRMLYGRPRQAS